MLSVGATSVRQSQSAVIVTRRVRTRLDAMNKRRLTVSRNAAPYVVFGREADLAAALIQFPPRAYSGHSRMPVERSPKQLVQ